MIINRRKTELTSRNRNKAFQTVAPMYIEHLANRTQTMCWIRITSHGPHIKIMFLVFEIEVTQAVNVATFGMKNFA